VCIDAGMMHSCSCIGLLPTCSSIFTFLSCNSDKLHSGGKNSDETTTAAPGTGSEAAFTSGSGSGYDQSSSTATSSSSEYGADGQRKKGLGEKAKEAVGLDPKDGRDPKDIGYGNSSTSGYNQDSSSYGSDETRGINRQSERMGDLSVSNSERAQQHTAAPVVQERVHDQYNNVDRTRVEELHDRTKVQQTVQPVYDERTEGTQRERKDHGLEVHEHGSAGLDTRTEAELAAKRQQLASEHRSTHDERTSERSARPDVNVERRTNTVEEVSSSCCCLPVAYSTDLICYVCSCSISLLTMLTQHTLLIAHSAAQHTGCASAGARCVQATRD
jgi:hypothetical protein